MTFHVHACPNCYQEPHCDDGCDVEPALGINNEGHRFGAQTLCARCERLAKCIDCREEIATVGNRCRDCDIAHVQKRMRCEDCGRTIMNDNARMLGWKPRDHAESCPRFCRWCDSRGCLVCAERIAKHEAESRARFYGDPSEHEECAASAR